MQQGVQTDATCNIQICWKLLVKNVASVERGLIGYKFRKLKKKYKQKIQSSRVSRTVREKNRDYEVRYKSC